MGEQSDLTVPAASWVAASAWHARPPAALSGLLPKDFDSSWTVVLVISQALGISKPEFTVFSVQLLLSFLSSRS